MGYNLWHKGIAKGVQIEDRLGIAIRGGFTAESYMNDLKAKGLSYRKREMLYDYRRASVIEQSKSMDAKFKATDFFDSVLEPLRVSKGLTQDKAMDKWHGIQAKMEELEELEEDEEEVWAEYESHFLYR